MKLSSQKQKPKKPTKNNSVVKTLLPYILTGIIVVTACSYVSLNCYRLMLIQGDSMLPAYHNLQLVVLDVKDKSAGYGDVIAFRNENIGLTMVKRVVGLPGDRLVIKDSKLYVNDKLSSEYENSVFSYSGVLEKEYIVPVGCCFAIGDNLEESKDCRYSEIGAIPIIYIIGIIK